MYADLSARIGLVAKKAKKYKLKKTNKYKALILTIIKFSLRSEKAKI